MVDVVWMEDLVDDVEVALVDDLLGLLIQIGIIPAPDAESARGSVEAQV